MEAIVGFIGNIFGFGAQNQNATKSSLYNTTPTPRRKTSPASKTKSSSAQSEKQARSRPSSKGPAKSDSPVVPKRLKLDEEPKVAKTPSARKPGAVRSSAKKSTPSKATTAKGSRSAAKTSEKAVAKSPKSKASSKPKASPKPKTARSATKAQTPKAAVKSTKKSTTNKTANWSLKWNAKDPSILAKDGSSDAWFEARPLDVMTNNDERLMKVSDSDKTKIRGIKAPSKRLSQIIAEEGDWVRIHFNGYNDRYDEWIRFCQGGHLCTGDDSACKCERHS